MTRLVRRSLWSLAIVVALVAAGVIAYLRYPRHEGDLPPELVPPAWVNVRTSIGHTEHVVNAGIACAKCHDYEREGFKSPGVAVCERCHAKEESHTHAGAGKTTCLTCHAFEQQSVPTCISCHKDAQGTHAAIGVIHASLPCANCHTPHGDPPIVATGCQSCHSELSPEHAKHAGSKGCFDCHSGHAPAALAKTTCTGCHATPAGPKPAGHDSCLSCHQPHDFKADGERVCVGCHAQKEKETLAATTVKEHATCTSCHAPHNPTQAATSCVNCHANVHTKHAGSGACTECHAPHGKDATELFAACTTCHAKVATSDTKAHAGGVNCTACHAPHDFPVPKEDAALCGSCHADEHAKTLASVPRGTSAIGHTACTSCHGTDAHRPARAPACGTCHAQELASAPVGHQSKCTSCHEPHSGAEKPQATCASCHARESKDTHATKIGNCESCHRPHGPGGIPSPPACTTCHATSTLQGLHAETRHQACASCHAPHEPPRADRATCTTGCHTDHRDHQPNAIACNGCHVFKN